MQKRGSRMWTRRFNSKVVRLEVTIITTSVLGYFGFNSKVVRLEVRGLQLDNDRKAMFQFQGGAVRRRRNTH